MPISSRAKKVADHPPEVNLPFLINRAAIALLDDADRLMAPFGLTPPKWRIIECLAYYGPLIVGDIAARTSIEASTLSRNLNELEASKLIGRTKVATDTRSVLISLTSAGAKKYRQVFPHASKTRQSTLHGLSESDIETLRRALTTVYQNVHNDERRRQPKAARALAFSRSPSQRSA
jgi:DNA-binding MarR family transcriptional regulator